MAVRILLALIGLSWLAAVAAEERPAAESPRQAAEKKRGEALRALTTAAEEFALARKEVDAAKDDAARQQAEKRLAAARQKMEAARREVIRQTTALRDAQMAAMPRGIASRFPPERESADPLDPVERFALLTPGGPLVVQAKLTIDGQPFRTVREKIIDQMMTAADADQDGKPTWQEALAAPRFMNGQSPPPNSAADSFIRNLDTIANGLVDRQEARLFVARIHRAPAFVVGGPLGFRGGLVVVNGRVLNGGAGQADVLDLLDVDSDGALDKREIAAAADRLKSRDSDDNDLLEAGELGGNQALYPQPVDYRQQQEPQQAVLLGPAADGLALLATLTQRYKNSQGRIAGDSFPAMPALFTTLDKDGNDRLDRDEVLGLNDIAPHVIVEVDLSASGKAKGLSLASLNGEFGQAKDASVDSIRLSVPGAKLALTANRTPVQTNFKRNAEAMLARFDRNKNGYLEKEEAPGTFGRQFELWDKDGDGKAFPEEIAAGYEQTQAPRASQIVVSLASAGNSLFSSLDTSGDLRLGAREIRSAGERIAGLDANADGRITAEEMPAMIVATFGLGSDGYGGYSAPPVPPRAASEPAPEWFSRMDRNGDGDLSLKEFLGTGSDFKKLDANGDGFLEAKEADAADDRP